jgi:hypothetical protein
MRYDDERSHHHFNLPCTWCGTPNNCLTRSDRTIPVPGDYVICTSCERTSRIINGPLGIASTRMDPAELDDEEREEYTRFLAMLREAGGNVSRMRWWDENS